MQSGVIYIPESVHESVTDEDLPSFLDRLVELMSRPMTQEEIDATKHGCVFVLRNRGNVHTTLSEPEHTGTDSSSGS